jgi:hypothetical protein
MKKIFYKIGASIALISLILVMISIESKFRDLSTNLNSFLKDISTDTIDKIIEQSINNKLLT